MKTYSLRDLEILDDPIAGLRKTPSIYAGEKPRGPQFSARLMRDLILLGALPARVERFDSWWLISAERDWLTSDEGIVSKRPFYFIVPFPVAGHAAFRTEVLLTAFVDAVVTSGTDGLEWLVGDQNSRPLPSRLVSETSHNGKGRFVAFNIDS